MTMRLASTTTPNTARGGINTKRWSQKDRIVSKNEWWKRDPRKDM